jgi:Trk K+ transport system NAD-binding subunit|tara:strand:+ start:1363 stop:1770 length:408 start_codon:yes stop_codon:yes gene_type:complete
VKVLILGTETISKIIGDSILEEVSSLVYVDESEINYKSWDFTNLNKVSFYKGSFKKIDTVISAGLETADLVIASTNNDSLNSFLAQKSKINFDVNCFIVISNRDIANLFRELDFFVIDAHNIDIPKIINKLKKIR